MRAKWEGFLQIYSICTRLDQIDDPHLHSVRNFPQEMKKCLLELGITKNEDDTCPATSAVRSKLREAEFSSWCSLSLKGAGVSMFADYTKGNRWVTNKSGLSSSQWTTALQMSCNCVSVRALPGRSSGTDSCRHCRDKRESLPHVLGFCSRGERLRTERHNRIVRLLKEEFQTIGYTVYEEMSCHSATGSLRRCDLVLIDKKVGKGWILDPTIRFEVQNPEMVNREKQEIYQPCIDSLKLQLNLTSCDFKVYGLMFGSRGTIPKFTLDILEGFRIRGIVLQEIITSIIRDSCSIINHHIYSHI